MAILVQLLHKGNRHCPNKSTSLFCRKNVPQLLEVEMSMNTPKTPSDRVKSGVRRCQEWVGSRPEVACKQFKKDLVLQPWQSPIRIAFRFETVWCVRHGSNLLLSNGQELPFTRVMTNGKCLVGLNDPYQTGLDYNEDAIAFRNALQQRMSEGCTHDSLKEKDGCQVCAICGEVLIP